MQWRGAACHSVTARGAHSHYAADPEEPQRAGQVAAMFVRLSEILLPGAACRSATLLQVPSATPAWPAATMTASIRWMRDTAEDRPATVQACRQATSAVEVAAARHRRAPCPSRSSPLPAISCSASCACRSTVHSPARRRSRNLLRAVRAFVSDALAPSVDLVAPPRECNRIGFPVTDGTGIMHLRLSRILSHAQVPSGLVGHAGLSGHSCSSPFHQGRSSQAQYTRWPVPIGCFA